MKQNKYDDPAFFAKYAGMRRSMGGLAAMIEWPVFRSLLPQLAGKRVLDLGCGYGWHCRYAGEQGAANVVGIDLSEKMLARARAFTGQPEIAYVRCPIEAASFRAGAFDVVISSLALHYVDGFDLVCRNVYRVLARCGWFVFSVEHPIFTAVAAQRWHTGSSGERLHWPVDGYQCEGMRRTDWLGEDVVKYHRTLTTYVNTLIAGGFRIAALREPSVPPEVIAERSDLRDENRRPQLLLLAAWKQADVEDV